MVVSPDEQPPGEAQSPGPPDPGESIEGECTMAQVMLKALNKKYDEVHAVKDVNLHIRDK